MKVWMCSDKTVFGDKDIAIAYSVEWGLASTKQGAGLCLELLDVKNEHRFMPMGLFRGVPIFALVSYVPFSDHPCNCLVKSKFPDRKVLLSIGDGPEGFEFYTSKDEGVVDWAEEEEPLYLTASVNGASVKLGPFQLKSIKEKLLAALK